MDLLTPGRKNFVQNQKLQKSMSETPSKLKEVFLQAKVEQERLEKQYFEELDKIQESIKQMKYVSKSKYPRWGKLRGLLQFLMIMKRTLKNQKIYGLASEIKFINNNDLNYKKKITMYNWLAGNIVDKNNQNTRKKYLLYPDNIFLKYWTYIIMLLFAYIIVVLPYKISFIENDYTVLTIIEWIVNVLFIIDILVTILTVYKENGEEVDNIFKIFTNYFKTWLFIDLLSIFPFDYFIGASKIADFAKLPRILKLLRIVRLLKFSDKLQNNNYKNYHNIISTNKQSQDFIQFFSLILVLTHITGCLWFFLTKLEGENNWFIHIPFIADSSFDKYLACIYWAISTICTVGFGDITPRTNAERIFNMIWICVGVAFYSYTIGTLSSILSHTNKKKSLISSQFSFINQFSKEKKIDQKLLEKITINLEYIEENIKYSENLSINFLKDISLDLTYEIARYIHKDLIEKVVLFNDIDINFIAQIIPYIQLKHFKSGDIIYKKNDYPSHLYFLLEGRVGLFNDSNKLFKTYVEGSYFGEIDIFKSCLRQQKIRALQDCQILLLPKENFLTIIKSFPKIQEEIQLRAIEKDLINKKSLVFMQKINFINFNSILDCSVKDQFNSQQRKCRRVIQTLKNQINNIVDEVVALEKSKVENNQVVRQLIEEDTFLVQENNQDSKNENVFSDSKSLVGIIGEYKKKLDFLRREINLTNQNLVSIYEEMTSDHVHLKQKNVQLNQLIQCELYYEHADRNSLANISSERSVHERNNMENFFEQRNPFENIKQQMALPTIQLKQTKNLSRPINLMKKKQSEDKNNEIVYKRVHISKRDIFETNKKNQKPLSNFNIEIMSNDDQIEDSDEGIQIVLKSLSDQSKGKNNQIYF